MLQAMILQGGMWELTRWYMRSILPALTNQISAFLTTRIEALFNNKSVGSSFLLYAYTVVFVDWCIWFKCWSVTSCCELRLGPWEQLRLFFTIRQLIWPVTRPPSIADGECSKQPESKQHLGFIILALEQSSFTKITGWIWIQIMIIVQVLHLWTLT